jgi:uncharacterized protein (TIGR02266 family)
VTISRRLTRVPIHLEVEYRTTGNFLVSFSTNLSKGGIFLQTQTPLPIGNRVKLKLHVPAIDDPLELEATVAWVRDKATADGPTGMGLEFDTMEEPYGDVIDRVVRSFKGIRILVVGVAGAGRSLVARYLRSIVSCDILELTPADTLGAAVQQADLALVDLSASGFEGLESLRNCKSRGMTPAIALAESDADKAAARTAGADEVLAMPPSFADLQSAVVRILAQPARLK